MSESYKVFNLIRTFDAKEQRQFKQFLKSPFFVRRNDVKDLYEVVLYFIKKDRPIPSLEKLFLKVFSNEEYDALKLRGTMSDLLELVEEFLLITVRRKEKTKNQLLLAKIYRQRNLEKNYKSTAKKVIKLIESEKLENAAAYENRLAFQIEQMNYQSSTKRTEHLYLQEISDTQDVLYLSQKLKNTCAQLSHQLVYKTTYDYGLLNLLLEEVDQEKYLQYPAIQIYYYCFRFLTAKEGAGDFQKFKQAFFQHKEKFTKEDLEAPYRLATNYCIRKLNKGNTAFAKEGWELYKEGIAQKILLENNQIPRFTFNNVIAMAILLEEYEWISRFIEDSAALLDVEFRAQTVSFNLARLAFAKKDFESALSHLQSVEYKDLVNVLISKMTIIKIYYEMKAEDALYANLDSFAQFIRRREVSDYHRNNFLTIIKMIKKLISIPQFDKKALQELQNLIIATPSISEQSWLLEKMKEQLKNKA